MKHTGEHIYVKFIYSEKATKCYEISALDLTALHTVKSKVEISQNFVAFSKNMNLRKKDVNKTEKLNTFAVSEYLHGATFSKSQKSHSGRTWCMN